MRRRRRAERSLSTVCRVHARLHPEMNQSCGPVNGFCPQLMRPKWKSNCPLHISSSFTSPPIPRTDYRFLGWTDKFTTNSLPDSFLYRNPIRKWLFRSVHHPFDYDIGIGSILQLRIIHFSVALIDIAGQIYIWPKHHDKNVIIDFYYPGLLVLSSIAVSAQPVPFWPLFTCTVCYSMGLQYSSRETRWTSLGCNHKTIDSAQIYNLLFCRFHQSDIVWVQISKTCPLAQFQRRRGSLLFIRFLMCPTILFTFTNTVESANNAWDTELDEIVFISWITFIHKWFNGWFNYYMV